MVGVDKTFVPLRIKSTPELPRVLSTEQKGQIAQAKVMMEAARKGYIAFLPISQLRYDLLLEREGSFLRVQVKYADSKSPHSEGAVRVDLRRRQRLYTREEFDLLLVYVPQIDQVCCFGPDMFDNRHGLQLRLKATLNGQRRGCLIAQDYVW
jgi:hypothetical protein